MSDDRLIPAKEREIFEAIISQLQDPEVVRLRRVYVLLGVCLFVLGSLAVAVVGKLGWHGMGAFCLTFIPGLAIGWNVYVRRFRRSLARSVTWP